VAAGLLRLMACWAPDDIPLSRLLPADVVPEGLAPEPARVLGQLTANDLELDAALADLYRFSLIRMSTGPSTDRRAHGMGGRRDGRLMSVHRLVQSVVLDQLSEEQRTGWADAARRLLERALPADPDNPVDWPTFRVLLPHVLAIHTGADNVLAFAGRFLHASGDYRSARRVEEEVVRARLRVSGAEHPDTLTAQGNLALTLADLGLWGQARGLQEEVVRARLRVSGAEHPDTLTAQGNLALTLADLGLLHDARRVEEAVVRARLRVLGPEHPDTVRAQGNLAGTLYSLGKWDEALRLQEQVVRARLRVLGPEHPATLRAQSNLALTMYSSGKLVEARRMQEQVVRARLRVSGANHPDTLREQSNLASTLAGLGKLVEARRLQEKVVRARLEVAGAGGSPSLVHEPQLNVDHAEGRVAQGES
jgi:tetratricopeptide (TPR) repeat protein